MSEMSSQILIKRPYRLTAYSLSTGDALYSLREFEDFSLKVTGEDDTVTDAMGSPIAIFDKAKQAEISGSASMLNLALSAAQFGSTPEVASTSSKITMPRMDELEVKDGKVTLSRTPVAASVKTINLLNPDGSLGKNFSVAAAAAADKFAITGKEITVPTGVTSGTILVTYDYEAIKGIKVQNNAVDTNKPVRLLAEVLGAEVCNPDAEMFLIVESKKAKLDSNVDLSMKTDGKHPFSYKITSDYCDRKKNLFNIFAYGDEEEE